jgi:hypothetical protein
MKPIEFSEIKDIADYELERPRSRPGIIALKEKRRIRVGEHLTFLFENRDTVRYQIQEMMRIEGITRPREIRHEVETYNELIPAQGELSATLLIEYETAEERDLQLSALRGLEHHIWMEAAGERVGGVFDHRQIGETRLSAVQFVKFRLSAAQITLWAQGASLVADHAAYRAKQDLGAAELAELAQDFM